jgi:hypothetical protein
MSARKRIYVIAHPLHLMSLSSFMEVVSRGELDPVKHSACNSAS